MYSRIKELLNVEEKNFARLMSFTLEFEKIPLWFLVRNYVYLQCLGTIYENNSIKKKRNNFLKVFQLFFGLSSILFRCKSKKKILLFSNDAGLSFREDGTWNNTNSDYFFSIIPHCTQSISFNPTNKLYLRRISNNNVMLNTIMTISSILGKITLRKISSKDKSCFYSLFTFINSIYSPFSNGRPILHEPYNFILKQAVMLPLFKKIFCRFVTKTGIVVALWEEASYLEYCYITKWLNQLGITTVEFQHGYVGSNHRAYNYPEIVKNVQEYYQYFPDYFLTYGEYWSNSIRIPGQTRVIGKPHFTEAVLNKSKSLPEKPFKMMLVISDGMTPHDTCNFVWELSQELRAQNDIRMAFRLHPRERSNYLELYSNLLQLQNCKIICEGDVYNDLFEADWVVGTYSTVLFEAAGIGKDVFVWKTKAAEFYMDKDFGVWIDTPKNLVQAILTNNYTSHKKDPEFYFASNWKERYIAFLRENDIDI